MSQVCPTIYRSTTCVPYNKKQKQLKDTSGDNLLALRFLRDQLLRGYSRIVAPLAHIFSGSYRALIVQG